MSGVEVGEPILPLLGRYRFEMRRNLAFQIPLS